MSYFAKVHPINFKVKSIILAEQEFIDTLPDSELWIQTSYNTRGGVHYNPETNEPSEDQSKALRKNYAGIGYTYDSQLDAFIPPKPFNSWTLNEESCLWDPPVAYPSDGNPYKWNEETQSWDLIEPE